MKNNYVTEGRVNQKLETRNKILASARYFIEQGTDFTLETIAKKAGISRATVYRYYSDVEILSSEAVLDIQTKTPKAILEHTKENDLATQIKAIQDYYNTLALDNEEAFRTYVSIAMTNNDSKIKRGARRKKTLQLALERADIPETEKNNLINFLTVIMGIEPIVVTKDVCNLNNSESKEVLSWGLEMILKGLSVTSK